MKRHAIWIILLLFQVPVHAQSKYLVENFWVENYTKKQGLPEDIIIDILQDSKGYMWMTTPYSLVKFDGYEFKSFSPRKDFPDLYIHFFTGLIEDSRGLLWSCTFGQGLLCFDPRTGHFTRYSSDDKVQPISSNSVIGVVEDNLHRIWAGSDKGMNCIDGFESKIKVHSFKNQAPEKLWKMLDGIFAKQQPLGSLSKIGDYEDKETWVNIKDTARVMIVCMGEEFSIPADYGWLEDETGKRIWIVDDGQSVAAGGDPKNRLQVSVLKLKPGKYRLAYKSDDSHSWNKWNATAPARPDWWGIHLFQLPAELTNSINTISAELSKTQGTRGESVKNLLKDSHGDIWALTNVGLEKLVLPGKDATSLTSTKIGLPFTFTPGYNIQEYARDSILIEGSFFDSLSKKSYPGHMELNIRDGKYQGFYDGQESFAGTSGKTYIKDKKGNYWKGTFNNNGEGLYVWDPRNTYLGFHKLNITDPSIKKSNQQNYEQIWTVYPDRSGAVWVGSRQTALYKIKLDKSPVNFVNIASYFDASKELKFDWISTDTAGNIWLLSTTDGLYYYNHSNQKVTHLTLTKEPASTLFMNPRDQGVMIAGSRQVKKYDPVSSSFKSVPVKYGDTMYVVAADRDGNLWAENNNTTDPHRAISYYDGKQFRFARFDSSIFNTGFYRDLSWGKNGNVWISPAFEGVSLYKLDNNTKQIRFVKRFLPDGVDVYEVYEDDKGIVWAGTYDDGLIRLDPSNNTYKAFTRKDGLPSNFISKIIPAGKQIWVITDQGSAFVDRETGNIRINKELNEYVFKQTDGTLFNAFLLRWYYPKAVTLPNGDIAFITTNGFCYFNPGLLRADTTKPILQITGLQIDKQSYVQGTYLDKSNFRLKYFQNDIEINFIGLHYDEPLENRYAYYLKGTNDDWVEAGKEKTVRFSNLTPGRYEFYLKASNADGTWTEPQKMFSFTIMPPWWKTWWAYTLYILLLGFGIWAFIRYRSRQLHKENVLLEEKVKLRTNELSESLEELKMTQGQLVQREKMASLGELTAGIAHEIQNPLNFVNNFSEVNMELIDEMNQELEAGHNEDVKTISTDIKNNEGKIIFHGKRADAIVKSMLQHSRTSSGTKEPTDINALADEYLRLSYHGLRAKDKTFYAKFETDFDPSVGMISVISQDIGRVILNLMNNAFYAVAEKKKQHPEGYDPTVWVSTKKTAHNVLISVKDNGNGIPQKTVDKIFVPFFTTKPSGQGTGLGLSLSYDIVTKGHGGELKVKTTEGQGSEFIIELPVG